MRRLWGKWNRVCPQFHYDVKKCARGNRIDPNPQRNKRDESPSRSGEKWFARANSLPREAPVFGEGSLPLVARFIKWAAAECNFPSGRCSALCLRGGGDTCLYHDGADLEYIRRFGRWGSGTFAIYLPFGGRIVRNLSPCLVRSGGMTSQLEARGAQSKRILLGEGGDLMTVRPRMPSEKICVGDPTASEQEKKGRKWWAE